MQCLLHELIFGESKTNKFGKKTYTWEKYQICRDCALAIKNDPNIKPSGRPKLALVS